MDTRPRVSLMTIFCRYGKPWEDRIILDYTSVRATNKRVLAKTWHGKILNVVFARSGILTYYA